MLFSTGVSPTSTPTATPTPTAGPSPTPAPCAPLDVDGDGLLDALTDGILAMRQLFELTGSELFEEGLSFAHERLPDVRFEQLDALTMDYDEAFDLICAFDVLEHIGDDEGVLRAFHRAITPGGGLVVTVPDRQT